MINSKQKAKRIIEKIVLGGTPEEKKALYGFTTQDSIEVILKKFKVFSRGCFPRFFLSVSAAFHDQMTIGAIESYLGRQNFLNLAFRGSSKTSLAKLFIVFILLNDRSQFRKYIKILTRDGKNSRQMVTDVYNLILEVQNIYGDVFEKESKIKRETTMSSFTTRSQQKLTAGTVGQTQRGHLQDAYRPDWLIFDDCEDRESIRSAIITEGIIIRCGEAIDGLSNDGSIMVLGNYISDQGVIEWFRSKKYEELIVPIMDDNGPTWPTRYSQDKIDQLKKDADDFWGEYMENPARSENKFFDIDRIARDIKNCTKPIRESAGVKYWGNYLPNHRYGIGSDHSEGIGQDANALALFDFTKGELIVTYANNLIAPDLSIHEFARVGAEFGNCIFAPETNNRCGGIAITTLKSLNYPNIYRQVDNQKVGTRITEKLGWDTNSKTKYNMFYEFRTDYNDGLIKIYDLNVLREMKAYTNSDLNEDRAGLITKHYDLLTSCIIAWAMRKHAVATSGGMKSYQDGYKRYLESVQGIKQKSALLLQRMDA